MSENTVISVQNVSKAYRIWESPAARLTSPFQSSLAGLLPERFPPAQWLQRRAARGYRDFWALQNISFEVKRGESIGIIGRNGSGKSTLLQIVAQTLLPTTGSASVRGRVAALLELGSGFNPEFTGRENIYLNGAVLGLSREQMDTRFDSIAAFADIGDFIDQPIKTYSSGMAVRLAFSVAVSVEPEILIVDEALSVGDVFFQQKCFKRVREMLSNGVSLLFVSHDVISVQNLCEQTLVLNKGETAFLGAPSEAATRYFALAPSTLAAPAAAPAAPDEAPLPLVEEMENKNILALARSRFGARRLIVRAATIVAPHGVNVLSAAVNESIKIVFLLEALTDVRAASFGVHVYDRMGECVFAAGARNCGVRLRDLAAGEKLLASYELQLSVAPGEYTLSVGCSAYSDPSDDGPNAGVVDDRHEGIGPLAVTWPNGQILPFYGKAALNVQINYHELKKDLTTDLLRYKPRAIRHALHD